MVKGRFMYVPKELVEILDDYKKVTNRNSDALRRVVYDARLGREFQFIAKERIPGFLKDKKFKSRLGL